MIPQPAQQVTVPLRPLALLALAAVSLFSTSCGVFLESAQPSLVEPRAAVPRDFLFSWHEPYNEWMDTPIRSNYYKTPLDQIFRQAPFNELSYNFIEKPDEMPLVTLDTTGLSRRQLLWSLAHDYNLSMILTTLPNGHPSEVVIRWRGEDERVKGRYDQVVRPEKEEVEVETETEVNIEAETKEVEVTPEIESALEPPPAN